MYVTEVHSSSISRNEIRLHRDAALDQTLTEVWGVTRESAAETNAEIDRWKAAFTPAKRNSA